MSVSVDTKDFFEKVFDNFKKITPALLVISISTALILFLPTSVLAKMSLDALPETWKRIIGIIFIVSLSLNIVVIIWYFYKKSSNKRLRKKMRKNFINLSPTHKRILANMLKNKNHCIQLDPYSGDTKYLENGLFIELVQTFKLVDITSPIKLLYVPQPWLIDLYEKEPELFKI